MVGLDEKLAALKGILEGLERVVVAYSGGVDSALLLWAALDTLGPERVLAATASSPIFARREMEAAAEVARQICAPHRFVPTEQMEDEQFVSNPPQRCYLCKRKIFTRLVALAQEEGLGWVIEGSNLDDQGEYRPGIRAARELGVRSPLEEAKLTKAEIRSLSHCAGLPTWDRLAQTCLVTRLPHDTPVTSERLRRVEAAEALLWGMGFGELRVRDHADRTGSSIARIEVACTEIARLARPDVAAQVVAGFTELGYRYVTLDMGGYRRGSLADGENWQIGESANR